MSTSNDFDPIQGTRHLIVATQNKSLPHGPYPYDCVLLIHINVVVFSSHLFLLIFVYYSITSPKHGELLWK